MEPRVLGPDRRLRRYLVLGHHGRPHRRKFADPNSAELYVVTLLRTWFSERTLWLRDVFGEPEPLPSVCFSD